MNIEEEIQEIKNKVAAILKDARKDYEGVEDRSDGVDPEEHYSGALLFVVDALDELDWNGLEYEGAEASATIEAREDWIDPDNAHEHIAIPASLYRALWNAGKLTAAQGLDLHELFDLVEDMADAEAGAGASQEDRTIELWRERIRETVRS